MTSPKDSGGGHAWSGLTFGADDVEYVHDGTLGRLQRYKVPPTGRQLDRDEKVAPSHVPDIYYSATERQTAAWLRRRGMETRSVNHYRRQNAPDSYVIGDQGTLEIKNPTTRSFLTNVDRIVRGAVQSDRVVLDRLGGHDREEAINILRRALEDAGEHLSGVIVVLEGGESCVYWQL